MTPDITEEARTRILLTAVEPSEDVRIVEGDKLQRVWPMPDSDPAASRSVYLSGASKEMDVEELSAVPAAGECGLLVAACARGVLARLSSRRWSGGCGDNGTFLLFRCAPKKCSSTITC